VKFIYSDLGEDALGLIYFVMTVNALLLFALEIGITSTTTREISAHFETDSLYVTQLIRTASLIYWLIFLLTGGAIYFLAPILVDKWLIFRAIDRELAIHALRVLGIFAFFAFPQSLYASLFRGLQRMEFNNIIDVAISLSRQCGIIVILQQEYGFLAVIYWISFTYVLEVIIYVVLLRKFFPLVSFLPRYFHSVAIRNIHFTSKVMVMTICGILHRQLDKIILSKFLPIGVLGFYSLAQRGVSVGDLVGNAINTAAYPQFSSLHRQAKQREMLDQYRKLQDFMCVGNALILSAIPFAMQPILSIVFSEEVARSLFFPVILMCLHAYINSMLKVPGTVAMAIGKPEFEMNALLYSLVIVIPFSIFAIRRFGIVGAPLGLLMLDIVFYVYAVPRYCKQCLKVPVKEWYMHSFKYLSLLIVAYGASLMVIARFDETNLFFLAAYYCVSTVVFLLGSVFVASDEAKATFIGFTKSMRLKMIGAP
jgi:O-antigen/teichoic acid export membrane protein